MGGVLGAYIDLQAKVMSFLRPAQWLGIVHHLNRARVRWFVIDRQNDIQDFVPGEILDALYEGAPALGFQCVQNDCLCCSVPKADFKAFYFTSLYWQDKISITIKDATTLGLLRDPKKYIQSEDIVSPSLGSEDLMIEETHQPDMTERLSVVASVNASSQSLGLFPVAIPLAPFLSTLLFWLPFFDHGQNLDHLRALRVLVEQHLDNKHGVGHFEVKERVVYPGGKMGTISFMILTFFFLLTVALTVWNAGWNTELTEVSVLITIVTAIVTALSFLTYFCGFLRCVKDYQHKHKDKESQQLLV